MVITVSEPNGYGERIKGIRKKQNKTLEEFGLLLTPPAPKSLVWNWEKERNSPNKERLYQIAEIGGVSVDYLLYGKQTTGIGKRIKEKREKIGLTAKELAKYIGYGSTEKDVNSWEEDISMPNENQLIELAVYLSTTISYLLIGEKDEISTNDVYLYSENSLDTEEKLKNSDLATDKKNKYTLFYRQFQDIILASIDNPNEFESFFNYMNETWNSLDKKNKTN
ncbi:helix-turn-helix domain-containing protein [Enterococcus sp. K18_3]|uniref:helix-turn-helix domain-containing protein n=1 Tax=Enterococcus sp. K18_3 TaxID=2718932 RepID=UPI001C8B7750|nr:helix-turn-helix domain-containing protein [Enterococcus sp. K18_3]